MHRASGSPHTLPQRYTALYHTPASIKNWGGEGGREGGGGRGGREGGGGGEESREGEPRGAEEWEEEEGEGEGEGEEEEEERG